MRCGTKAEWANRSLLSYHWHFLLSQTIAVGHQCGKNRIDWARGWWSGNTRCFPCHVSLCVNKHWLWSLVVLLNIKTRFVWVKKCAFDPSCGCAISLNPRPPIQLLGGNDVCSATRTSNVRWDCLSQLLLFTILVLEYSVLFVKWNNASLLWPKCAYISGPQIQPNISGFDKMLACVGTHFQWYVWIREWRLSSFYCKYYQAKPISTALPTLILASFAGNPKWRLVPRSYSLRFGGNSWQPEWRNSKMRWMIEIRYKKHNYKVSSFR